MMLALFAGLLVTVAAVVFFARYRRLQRDQFIRSFTLPKGLLEKLAKRRPELDLKQRALVARALRQFFLAYLHSGKRYVAMPSQVVDDLWHEFILYTKTYDAFCRRAFGGFLHHTPAVVLGSNQQDNAGLRRVWWYSCKDENIHPGKPLRLPLLFALDEKFGIADGFRYTPDCSTLRRQGNGDIHCGGSFSDSSIDGGTDGYGDNGSANSSDSAAETGGGDSGCGGGGCGGD